MFKAEIVYKSGKIEKVIIADIEIQEYTQTLTSLVREGRLISFSIVDVR